MKKSYIVHKVIDPMSVRSLCIQQHWYTRGTTLEYEAMLQSLLDEHHMSRDDNTGWSAWRKAVLADHESTEVVRVEAVNVFLRTEVVRVEAVNVFLRRYCAENLLHINMIGKRQLNDNKATYGVSIFTDGVCLETEDSVKRFEAMYAPIPAEYRWLLLHFGGCYLAEPWIFTLKELEVCLETEDSVKRFEAMYAPIPAEYRWLLLHFGGCYLAEPWIFTLKELEEDYSNFQEAYENYMSEYDHGPAFSVGDRLCRLRNWRNALQADSLELAPVMSNQNQRTRCVVPCFPGFSSAYDGFAV